MTGLIIVVALTATFLMLVSPLAMTNYAYRGI